MDFPVLTVKPSISSGSVTETFDVLECSFGDGYSQTAPNGPNYRKVTWPVAYVGVLISNDPASDYMKLMNFLNSVTAVTGFTFSDLPYSEGYLFGSTTLKQWKIDAKSGITRKYSEGNSVDVSFQIKQIF